MSAAADDDDDVGVENLLRFLLHEMLFEFEIDIIFL